MPVRVLFATTHGHLPQRAGGSQSSTHELCIELMGRGVEPAVLATLDDGGFLTLLNRVRRKLPPRFLFPADRRMGYRTYRGWDPVRGVPEVCDRFRPHVAVVQAGRPVPLADALLDAGVPTVLYLRDTRFELMGGPLAPREGLAFVANSEFTARSACAEHGIDAEVIPPLVRPEAYRTETTAERVLFVNPHPDKGVDVAFAVAEARPDVPFQFLEAWPLREDLRRAYRERAERAGNIEWSTPIRDMREAYGRARLVLAPSRWDEPWGRIATEAQVSGIPVLASAQGGLPEAVGPGGVLVDPDAPIEQWIDALGRIWDDPETHARLSRAALEHSTRPEIQPETLLERLIGLLRRHAGDGLREA